MRRLLLIALLLVTACATQTPDPPEEDRYTLRVVSGGEQEAPVTEALAQPLVFALEDQHGDPLEGVEVTFALAQGQGGFDPTSAETDAEGLVQTELTFGTLAGTHIVDPEVDLDDPSQLEEVETLVATALPGPAVALLWSAGDGQKDAPGATLQVPLSLSVQDEYGNGVSGVATSALASEGSTVSPASGSTGADGAFDYDWTLGAEMGAHSLTGSSTGFEDVVAGAESDQGPHLDYYNPSQPLETGDRVWIYGENFCEEPLYNDLRLGGEPMEVLVATEEMLTATVPVGLTFGEYEMSLFVGSQEAPEVLDVEVAMGLGTVLDYPAVDGEVTIPLAASGSGPQYLVALYSLKSTGPYSPQSITLAEERIIPSAGARPAGDPYHDFHARLLQVPDLPPAQPATESRGVAAERESFYVLNDINGYTSNPESYTQISATLRYSGSHILIYVDNRDLASMSLQQIEELGLFFDSTTWDVDTGAFGMPSDFDENGKVKALLTREVNDLTPWSYEDPTWPENAYIGGFFNPADLDIWSFPPGTTNHAEIFYGLVPDPGGLFSPHSHGVDETVEGHKPLFAHEFQHMINMAQRHYYVGNWQTPQEELWLNEGLSHLAEHLCGFSDHNQDRVGLFLHSQAHRFWALADLAGVSPPVGNELAERGASFLFCRYMEDRWPGIAGALVQSTVPGRQNVTQASGEDYEQVFKDWIAALYLDGREYNEDPRFQFQSLDIRTDFPYNNGPDEPLAIPERFLSNPGVNASIMPSTFDFVLYKGPAPGGAVDLKLQAPNLARAGALVIRIGY